MDLSIYNSLKQICLIWIGENLDEISTFYRNQNINPKILFKNFPPTICEDLFKILSTEINPRILSYFFREGIKIFDLSLYNHNIPSRKFAKISPKITYVNLDFARMSEGNLKQLIVHLRNVLVLCLCRSYATDSVVEIIGKNCSLLQSLDLSFCSITDEGLRCLCHQPGNREEKRCRYLRILKITGTAVTAEGMAYALEFLPLSVVNVERNIGLTMLHFYVQHNFGKLLNLTNLCLFPIEKIETLEILLTLPLLKTLCLYKVSIDDTDIISLPRFHNLQRLSISIDKNNKTLTFEEGIVQFLSLSGKNIEKLKLNNFEYVNIYLIGRHCQKLRHLELFSIRHLYFKKEPDELLSIFDSLQKLTIESLRNDPWEECLSLIFKNCSKLTDLVLISCSCLTDSLVLEILPFLKNLKWLDIYYCENISKHSIYSLIYNLPLLQSFWISSRKYLIERRDEKKIKKYIRNNASSTNFHYWWNTDRNVPSSDQFSIGLEEMQFY